MSEEPEVIDEDEDVFLEDEDGEETAGDLEEQLERALDVAYIEGEMKEADEAERPATVPLLAVVGADGVWRLPSEPPGTPAAGGKEGSPSPTPEESPLDERGAQELLGEIWALNDEIKDVRCEMGMRKAQFKALKGKLDALRERQDELTDRKKAMERAEGEKLPLLDARPAGNGSPAAEEKPAEPPPADPDAWRKAPVSDLVLPPAILSRLEENDVRTIGQLEDLRASPKGLNGVKGFGVAKITLIEDAVMEWLKKNRDHAVFAAAGAGAGTPANESEDGVE